MNESKFIEMKGLKVTPEAVQARCDFRDSIFSTIPNPLVTRLFPKLAAKRTFLAEKEKHGVALAQEKHRAQRHAAETGDPSAEIKVQTVDEIQAEDRLVKNALTNQFAREHLPEIFELLPELSAHLRTLLEEELAEELLHDRENEEYFGVNMPPSFASQILAAELARLDATDKRITEARARLAQQIQGRSAITQIDWPSSSYILTEALKHIESGALNQSKAANGKGK